MSDPLDTRHAAIDTAIEDHLDSPVDLVPEDRSSHHLRGQLLFTVYEAVGVDPTVDDVLPAAVAIELSTLHLRLHSRIDEETTDVDQAILHGDYLQAKAFEALARIPASPQINARCYRVLAGACIDAYGRSLAARDDPREPLIGAATALAGVVADVDHCLQRRLDECGAALERAIAIGIDGRTLTEATHSGGESTVVEPVSEELPSSIRGAIDELLDCVPDERAVLTNHRLTTLFEEALFRNESLSPER